MEARRLDRRGDPIDPSLIHRAQQGDEAAFAAIVERSIGRLNAIARLVVRDGSVAEEAVQEALLDAWRSLPGLRQADRFDAWLRRLLMRACFDLSRRDKRRQATEIWLAGADQPITDGHASLETRDWLESALARLSTGHRAVLVLTYYLDLPLADSAAMLGIPVGTMKSRLDRARDALRAAIEAQERVAPRSWEALT